MSPQICLLGATGFTGRLVAELLTRDGIALSIAGRSAESLELLQKRLGFSGPRFVVDLTTGTGVATMLEHAHIIINCVGPYELYCHDLIGLIVNHSRRLIYLDITGEQSFVGWSMRKYHTSAKASGITLVHSVSFESAFADLLAALVCDSSMQYIDISSFYKLGNARPSPGTYFTMSLARHRSSWVHEKSTSVTCKALEKTRNTTMFGEAENGYLVPYPEVVFFSNRYQTENAASYFVWPDAIAKNYIRYAELPAQSMATIVQKHQNTAYAGPNDDERAAQRCQVGVVAHTRSGDKKFAVMDGFDPYSLTAAIVMQAVKYVSANPDIPAGVWGPADVLPARDTFDRLKAEHGVTVSVTELNLERGDDDIPQKGHGQGAASRAGKLIGVVGGVGPYAGLDLVKKISDGTSVTCDQEHLPVALLSLPHTIADRTDYLLGRTEDNPGLAIAAIIDRLKQMGAEVIGIPCNTAHAPAIFDVVRSQLPRDVLLLNMIEEVARELVTNHPTARRVGILSTTGTRQARVYEYYLSRHDVQCVSVPHDIQSRLVQPSIYDRNYGIKATGYTCSERAIRQLEDAAAYLISDDVQIIILGCTELVLALGDTHVNGVKLLDPGDILAQALIRESRTLC